MQMPKNVNSEISKSNSIANFHIKTGKKSLDTAQCPSSLFNKQIIPDVDDIIKGCIDSIWNKYDSDGSGYLDHEECFSFVMESVQGSTGTLFTQNDDMLAQDDELENQEKFKRHFDQLYVKLDADGNGVISKEEMLYIIKEMIGL